MKSAALREDFGPSFKKKSCRVNPSVTTSHAHGEILPDAFPHFRVVIFDGVVVIGDEVLLGKVDEQSAAEPAPLQAATNPVAAEEKAEIAELQNLFASSTVAAKSPAPAPEPMVIQSCS